MIDTNLIDLKVLVCRPPAQNLKLKLWCPYVALGFRTSVVMPLKVLTEEQKAAGLSKMGPELRALLEDKGVAVEVMASLGHLGLVLLATFANIEQTAEHLRELIEKELGFTRNDGFADRAMVSNLLEAWETAALLIKEVEMVVAERKAVGRELQIGAPESKSLRTAHEKVWGGNSKTTNSQHAIT